MIGTSVSEMRCISIFLLLSRPDFLKPQKCPSTDRTVYFGLQFFYFLYDLELYVGLQLGLDLNYEV